MLPQCFPPCMHAASEAATAAFESALKDLLHKKKSRLHRTTLEEAARQVPQAALPALPALLQGCVSGGACNTFTQSEALQLLASVLRGTPASKKQLKQQQQEKGVKEDKKGKKGAKEAEGSAAAAADATAELAAALKRHQKALGAAIVAATAGEGMKKDAHAAALKAAVSVLESLRRVLQIK